MNGVILYGPPASGKDTITTALTAISPRYRHFHRLKVGGTSTATYRMTTREVLDRLRANGGLVWENSRYGAIYAIDRAKLQRALGSHITIVHLGQIAAIRKLRSAVPSARWIVAYLWCPRDLAHQRLVGRGATDIGERLQAWDETECLEDADVVLDTAALSPADAATAIHDLVVAAEPGPRLTAALQQHFPGLSFHLEPRLSRSPLGTPSFVLHYVGGPNMAEVRELLERAFPDISVMIDVTSRDG
jgi:guanylate kinase